MAFTWNGRFVLRRIIEDDPRHHRIYKHSDKASEITDADNTFAKAPYLATKAEYEAVSVEPPRSWNVALQGYPAVEMGVYQLRSIR